MGGYENRTSPWVSESDRREFLKALGVVTVGGMAAREFTLQDLSEMVTVEAADELASIGGDIRSDVKEALNAKLLHAETAALANQIERIPALHAAGVPDTPGGHYEKIVEPAWRIEDHLAEAGLFSSAEEHFPTFTPDHIASTTQKLVQTNALASLLAEIGFGERERTDLAARVVNDQEYLAQWVPVEVYPDEMYGPGDDSVDPETVAPLHRRAAGGALLWIDGLDKHLWQYEVLVTDEILDNAALDVKAMLGGFYVLGHAANDLARGEISDEMLSAMITGATGIMIVSQNQFATDVARITDEMRAPRMGGA